MHELIKQKISSIEVVSIRINNVVDQTFLSIITDFKHSAIGFVSDQEKMDKKGCKSSYKFCWVLVSIVGVIGWIITDALWAKMLFGVGVIGFTLNFILCKNKKPSEPSKECGLGISISTQKKNASQKVLSVIDEISNLWENLTKNNKEDILALIESSKLSVNDKFNASSCVTVTKTLSFELLRILNLIDESRSIVELEEKISQIRKMLKSEINDVTNLQIGAYRQVEKIMENV